MACEAGRGLHAQGLIEEETSRHITLAPLAHAFLVVTRTTATGDGATA